MIDRRRSAAARLVPPQTPERPFELTQEHIRPLLAMIDRLNEAGAEDELRVISKQLTRLVYRAQLLPTGKYPEIRSARNRAGPLLTCVLINRDCRHSLADVCSESGHRKLALICPFSAKNRTRVRVSSGNAGLRSFAFNSPGCGFHIPIVRGDRTDGRPRTVYSFCTILMCCRRTAVAGSRNMSACSASSR